MNIVIPMAGRGARFRDAGWTTPKPLINVLGEPLYAWALKGLPLGRARRIILIALKETAEDAAFHEDLHQRLRGHEIEVLTVSQVTEGQACTVLLARALIDNDERLLIFNADTYQRSARLLPLIDDPENDGVLSAFEAPGDHWSFVRTGDSGTVLETAEKRRISKWASTGMYYFRRGADFVRVADAAIAEGDRTRGEFYVAPLYNRLIAEGAHIAMDVVDEVQPLGTPAEVDAFLRRRGKPPLVVR